MRDMAGVGKNWIWRDYWEGEMGWETYVFFTQDFLKILIRLKIFAILNPLFQSSVVEESMGENDTRA